MDMSNDSDRFATTQEASSYDFGNPGTYTADLTFFYNGPNIHTRPPEDCSILPFSCYLREGRGPLTYSQMMDSVFGGNGSIEYGEGWEGATGGAFGSGGFSAFGGNDYNVTGPNGEPVRFESADELFAFFEEEPEGSYFICGNGNDPENSACVIYEHDPEDPMWRENLQEAIDAETPVAPAPPTVDSAILDIDLSAITP